MWELARHLAAQQQLERLVEPLEAEVREGARAARARVDAHLAERLRRVGRLGELVVGLLRRPVARVEPVLGEQLGALRVPAQGGDEPL